MDEKIYRPPYSQAVVDKILAETARLRAESARRLALLRELEWVVDYGAGSNALCQICHRTSSEWGGSDHAPDCALAKELKEAESE